MDARKGRNAANQAKEPYYPTGLISCGQCGHNMRAIERKKDYGITNDDAMYSIRRTSNMSWGQLIKSALKHNGKIQHMNTLVVITKAQKGKNADHAISDKNLIALQYGIENAITVIDNPERNSLAFITSLEEDGGRVVVFFDINVQFYGDQVNKATSIHRRTNIVGLMNNLSDNSIIYVKIKTNLTPLWG